MPGKFLNRIAAVQVFGELMMDFLHQGGLPGLILGKSGVFRGQAGEKQKQLLDFQPEIR